MKPVSIVRKAILNSSKPMHTVAEPFCGGGSTLIACEQTRRKCAAIELDPKFCDVIVKRWEHFTGEKAEKIGEMPAEDQKVAKSGTNSGVLKDGNES